MIRREPKTIKKFIAPELAVVHVGMSPAIGAEMPAPMNDDGTVARVGALPFSFSLSDVAYPLGGAAIGSLVGLLLLPSMLGLGLVFGAVGGAAVGYAISQSMA